MVIIYCLASFAFGVIGTLAFLLTFGCKHIYETRIHKVNHYHSDGTPKYTSWIYTNTCKYCGKVKVKEVGKKC